MVYNIECRPAYSREYVPHARAADVIAETSQPIDRYTVNLQFFFYL